MVKVEFEDRGQDLLWWIVDNAGTVISAGPFHNSLYEGSATEIPGEFEVGDKLKFYNRFGHQELKYPIVKIEPFNPENYATRQSN